MLNAIEIQNNTNRQFLPVRNINDYPMFKNSNYEDINHHIKPQGLLCQDVSDFENLYQEAANAYPFLQKLTHSAAKGSYGIPYFPAKKLKGKSRAIRKINSHYGGEARFITDILRASIIFKSLNLVYQGLEAVCMEKHVEILLIKDRFLLQPSASGYRDINIRLRLPNGHVAEIQLHHQAYFKVKRVEDEIYRNFRELRLMPNTSLRQQRLATLNNFSQRLYQWANQQII